MFGVMLSPISQLYWMVRLSALLPPLPAEGPQDLLWLRYCAGADRDSQQAEVARPPSQQEEKLEVEEWLRLSAEGNMLF